MIDSISIEGKKISFDLISKRKADPLVSSIRKACVNTILSEFGEDVDIKGNITIKEMESKEERKVLPKVKNIIAVASGKGGVGKSTVASNLAVAFAKMGYKTGIIDADIFGPSIPKMFNVENEKPSAHMVNEVEMLIPIEQYGVKVLSIGFFVDPKNALIWRGPMATNALRQFIHQGDWGELDFLLIDLPPGTSDIHLTMVQEMPVTGAVVVSTPQNVAIADAMKGINMFMTDKINIPVLGLVENMSWFTPEELPENKYYIFGKDGVENLAKEFNMSVLGQIPIVQGICESGDKGTPSALDADSIIGKAFFNLAENVVTEVNKRNLNIAPSQIVEITNTDGCAAAKN
jgi:ATP-binding protein involved in chromosome partitioning